MAGDSGLVEGIKLLGGIAGLATAGFTIWDRLFTGRPVVTLHAYATDPGATPRLQIQMKNVAPCSIVVRRFEVGPDTWRVYTSSHHSMWNAVNEKDDPSFIEPDERASFWTNRPYPGGQEIDAPVTFTVRWRRTDNWRLPVWPVKIVLTPAMRTELFAAAQRAAEVRHEGRGHG